MIKSASRKKIIISYEGIIQDISLFLTIIKKNTFLLYSLSMLLFKKNRKKKRKGNEKEMFYKVACI